jgi:hypothetical protein
MNSIMVGVIVLAAAGIGCGSESPLAPEAVSSTREAAVVTISGQVYLNATWGEPPIGNASIAVKRDASEWIVTTDAAASTSSRSSLAMSRLWRRRKDMNRSHRR